MTSYNPVHSRQPIADTIFEKLLESFDAANRRQKKQKKHDGVLSETVELFVEQFSQNVIGYKILGIGRGTRERLEQYLREATPADGVADVVSATADLCKELSAQSYVPLSGLLTEFVIPWLESIRDWLTDQHNTSRAIGDATICIDLLRKTAEK